MGLSAGVCNLCGTGCGHFLRIADGRVVAVAPSLSHPVSQGRLCVRGWHIHELLATGERIATPLIRDHGELRPATYAEAIAVLRERLAALPDPASQLGVIGSARSSNEDNFLLAKLAREVLGTRQLGVTSQANHVQTRRALELTFGAAGAIGSLAEIEHAHYILVVGSDLTKLNPIVGSNIHRAARRGSRVVALSSTRTQLAKLATRHLQQKPGAKRLAVNGLLKAIVARRLTQPDFAERSLPGFAELERALTELTPGAIEAGTGIRYAELELEAQQILDAESLLVIFSSGISGLDAETINSVVDLAAVSGKLGAKSSGILPITGICNLQGSFDVGLTPATAGPDLLARLGAANGPLRALFVVDHDDGIIRQRERIAALDLVVYVGSFKNRFMELAHVVFPVATFAEDDGTFTASDRRVQLSPAKIAPPANVLPAWRLYRDIASAAGKGWKHESARDVFAEIAQTVPGYAGLSHQALTSGFGRHCDAAAKVRCQRLLPIHTAAPTAGADAAFPFALMIGKAQHFWHQHNLMRKTLIPRREYDATLLLYPEGYVEISAGDARRLQVRDKWPVKVSSTTGSMKIAVKISEDVQDGSAYIPYFIDEMISGFLMQDDRAFTLGEDGIIPIRIEKV
jgi:predicted molibdopterin-dependent oxidoreductase YjgC